MKENEENISAEYIFNINDNFKRYKEMAEKAIAQVSDQELHFSTDEEQNSIAIIMQHISGNLKSRFNDFYYSDGEKPDRNRDQEFEEQNLSKKELLENWDSSWEILLSVLSNLSEVDLLKTVAIRKEKLTVIKALERSLTHTVYHVGQIVQLAKLIKKDQWQTLSIPKRKNPKNTINK
jgi:Protein of unknown function (DUF1572)